MPFPDHGLDGDPTVEWPLLESVSIRGCLLENAQYHQRRFDAARRALRGTGLPSEIDLRTAVESRAEELGLAAQRQYKGRIRYDSERIGTIEFEPYQRPRADYALPIEVDRLSYRFKWADRTRFQELIADLPPGAYPLFVRGGLLADGLSGNIVLELPEGFRTPATPLLAGTMREQLLETGRVSAADLDIGDFRRAKGIWIVNALNPLGSWQLKKSIVHKSL